jgi:S1-C subfamily serine protease
MKKLIPFLIVHLVGALCNPQQAVALTTIEVVAKAKPCVVTIVMSSSKHDGASGGTGFFIAKDRIITAYHIQDGDWDQISVHDLAGTKIDVSPDCTYGNGDKDIDLVILKSTDGKDHPYLSFAIGVPLEGENVIAVGNPQGLTGTVSTGIVSAIRKNGNLIQFTAPVSNGSSGCPILDEDGNVIGLADWIRVSDGKEVAENLNFAIGAPVLKMALANDGIGFTGPVVQAQPAPSAQTAQPTASKFEVPTQFGNTRQGKDGSTLTTVLREDPAWGEISAPVVVYLYASDKGTRADGLFMTKLTFFYDLKDCTYEQAWAKDQAYAKHWPHQSTTIDYAHISVERVNWTGTTCYWVLIPIDWTVSNSHQSKNGHTVVAAYVVPGVHTGTHNPDYFIRALGNVKTSV